MDFLYFKTTYTNIWPMSNSKNGGQLLSEFNITSKESVSTAPSVEYKIGPSYVHSNSDFAVTVMLDGTTYFPSDVTYTASALQISKGRAVVNGYFVESLIPIVIDLAQINRDIVDSGEGEPLVGELAIGLRTFFSDDDPTYGTLLVELEDGSYGGVAVVILPKDEFITPTTVIGDVDYGKSVNRSGVTADLLLATFNYSNGNISNIQANPTVQQYIPAERISNITDVMSDVYVRKTGLQPKRLYTFSGKGIDPSTGLDTWCDSTDSLMVWDVATPEFVSEIDPSEKQAKFEQTVYGVNLFIPHKQVDGMVDGSGNPQYFAPVRLPIPVADYNSGTPGIVNATYTEQVKNVVSMIHELYTMPYGKQKTYIEELNSRDDLPPIYQSNNIVTEFNHWQPGDYVLVAKDRTITSELNDSLDLTPPSSIYVILPPRVQAVEYSNTQPLDGVQLAIVEIDAIENNYPNLNPEEPTDEELETWWGPLAQYRGQKDDYFTLVYTTYPGDVKTVNTYYYKVANTYHDKVWSEPIQLTGQLPFATAEMIGGFLNVSTADIDSGYVYLDENGHLRLLDYSLLRSGTLAYQLGENFTVPSGLTYAEIQATLDEYVNERVAFPNANQIVKCEADDTNPSLIYVYINLPENTSDVSEIVEIKNIDSRFGSAVNVVLSGAATDNVVVLFRNCQKLMVTYNFTNSTNGPKLGMDNCELFYDAEIMSKVVEFDELSLWHKWYIQLTHTNPNLVVSGLTVSKALPEYNSLSVEPIDYWTDNSPNDNHMQVKLRSLTFDTKGNIVGCGVLVRNDSSDNIQLGRNMIYDNFTLPLNDLPVPVNRLKQPMYISGQYLTGYTSQSPIGYIVQDTKFTIKTQPYDDSGAPVENNKGELVAMVDSYNYSSANPVEIDAWDPSTYHLFNGSVNG